MATAVEQPQDRSQPATPFERIGGHAVLRRITDRFYDLSEQDPAYAVLRAMHAADLTPMRESAGQWAEAMRRAVQDAAPEDTEIAEAFIDVLTRMALGMARG